jgi:hypothetical protein
MRIKAHAPTMSPPPTTPDRLLAALHLRDLPEPIREYAEVIIRLTSGALMADTTGIAWHWLTEPAGRN